MRRRHGQTGSALLVATIGSGVLMSLSGAYFMVVMSEAKTQQSTASGTSAFYVAEAGLAEAVMELRTTVDLDGNGAVGSAAGTFNGSPYNVTMTDMGDGTLQLTAVATVDGVQRAVEVRITSAPPIPAPGLGAQAALAVLGKLGKKGKLDLHMKKPGAQGADDDVVEPDEEAEWTSESTSPVAIDGNDAAGVKPALPAVGIEDATTYAKVTDKIAHDMFHGKIPEDAFLGDPVVTIHSDKHEGIDMLASIAPLQTNPTSLNYENLNDIADQIEVFVDTQLIPSANVTVSGKNVKISKDTTWGSPNAPQVVLIDGNKVEVQPNVTVTGYGTLIVQGDLSLLNKSTFNWTGDVIIMGGTNKDALFQNKMGTLTVDGSVLVLGTDSNKKRSVLSLHNDINKTNVSTTTINGAVLVWTGNNTDKAEKAEFKAKHGRFDIDGFIGVYGDKTKLDVKIDDKKNVEDGGFTVHGGVVVAVPGSDEKHKAKVHLHGDDILIQYDSIAVEAAIGKLLSFASLMEEVPVQESYQIVSWRRVMPAVGAGSH